jgi:CcmD family protein
MENMGFLFAAYSIVWALIFGFVLIMYNRQRKLRRKIDLLSEEIEQKHIK